MYSPIFCHQLKNLIVLMQVMFIGDYELLICWNVLKVVVDQFKSLIKDGCYDGKLPRSYDEARMKKIYSVSTRCYYAFGALVNHLLMGRLFHMTQSTIYEEWIRNNARANERNRRNGRPRNFDRSKNFERRENMQTNRVPPGGPPPSNMGGPPPNMGEQPPNLGIRPQGGNMGGPPPNNWNNGPPQHYGGGPPHMGGGMPPQNNMGGGMRPQNMAGGMPNSAPPHYQQQAS
ncbi:hypothetical protein CTI12_AA171520 [Artemisia annua]|uniref:Uncharacterized protein n=1 Tax=Artemisia annua TaxID=35608 RepID=A0A2U1PBD1_ARTAN|nr:hypothetical protein CTI12_AA171520 [Artemisia annua]